MNKIFPNCLLFFLMFFIFSCAGDREKKDNSELYSKSQTRGAIIERAGVTMGSDNTPEGRKLQMEVAQNKLQTGGGLFSKKGGIDLLKQEINIIFANEQEIKSLFETENFENAINSALNFSDTVVVTRGTKGSVVAQKNTFYSFDAIQVKKVIDKNGRKITMTKSFIRTIVYILQTAIPGINMVSWLAFFMIAFTEENQGLHDVAAETYVVSKYWDGPIPLQDNFGA